MKQCKPFINAILAIVLIVGVSLPAKGAVPDIQLKVIPGTSYVRTGRKQILPVKIGLTGFSRPGQRAPVNVAIVLDQSGSMSGQKMQKAKEAAVMAVRRLNSQDIVSVVAYDYTARVIVPATAVYNPESIVRAIRNIRPNGSTALFAGVSHGASELRRFINREKVNRIILLSDGLANVGPSSPGALGQLGNSLGREGIAVTTIGLGLGYNEDLMVALARNSDGNHAFAENAHDLARIFDNEFGDILSVVAQNLTITIVCDQGIRPIRVIGREADVYGQRVVASLNQVYAAQEKYLMLEVEVPAETSLSYKRIGTVKVDYNDMASSKRRTLSSNVGVSYTNSDTQVQGSANKEALEAYYTQLTNLNNARAIELRDAGRKKEAQAVLHSNADIAERNAAQYGISSLNQRASEYRSQALQVDRGDWKRTRKSMQSYQDKHSRGQAW